ncbi:cilia- and flagella-associated protein 263 [Cochliomyia hominivorax]
MFRGLIQLFYIKVRMMPSMTSNKKLFIEHFIMFLNRSLYSKSSNITALTVTSGNLVTTARKIQPQPQTDVGDNEFAVENFINSLQLSKFFQSSDDEQKELLKNIDVLELFRAVQYITHELGMLQLENYFLIDFLQKNDAKLLIGLAQHRATAHSVQGNLLRSGGKMSIFSMPVGGGGGASLGGYRSRSITSKSLLTSLSIHTLGSQKKVAAAQEYKLNYRAKADMAEKLANEVEKRLNEIERNATHDIKQLRAQMEELNFTYIETQETAKNFELHFLSDANDLAFLSKATEKQIDRKFRKFVNNWTKNARALLATMRLKITNLHEHCQQLRNELLTKADLSGILTAIDFEKLIIKRAELLNALEEKNVHMAGLKGVTGRAALSMAEEKQIMMNIEQESKRLSAKTIELAKTISKLEKEAEIVEAENEKDIMNLESLRSQLEHYEAPSVNEYVERKNEVLALEKEEKMLRRKIYILQMKLDNTQKKCKRSTNETNIIINMIE